MKRSKLTDMVIFALLGTIMFISKILMEGLPNIHPLAMFIVTYTYVYRVKALIPIYIFVLEVGLLNGFNVWWIPYIYIWTILWALAMLIPKRASLPIKAVFGTIFCGLHGILYGTLYAPYQAIMFGLDFEGMIAWIVAGFPWDITHMIGNLAMSVLIIPLYKIMTALEQKRIK